VVVYDHIANINFLVDRVLRKTNLKKWIAKLRPKLKPEHFTKRLRWAMAHRD